MAEHRPSPTIEDYLLTIHYLGRDGTPVIGARLAEKMEVSAATVTNTIQRMVRDGLVHLSPQKVIKLTDRGRELAESIVRRHGLAERLLSDILGLSWHEVHQEAHRVEHAISPRIEERLLEVLGYPTTCPHGNPLPGTGATISREAIRLSTVAEQGKELVVERIEEEAETEPRLLQFLEEHGVKPGAVLQVAQLSPHLGTIGIFMPATSQSAVLGLAAAAHIWVRPAHSNQ